MISPYHFLRFLWPFSRAAFQLGIIFLSKSYYKYSTSNSGAKTYVFLVFSLRFAFSFSSELLFCPLGFTFSFSSELLFCPLGFTFSFSSASSYFTCSALQFSRGSTGVIKQTNSNFLHHSKTNIYLATRSSHYSSFCLPEPQQFHFPLMMNPKVGKVEQQCMVH